VGEQLGEDAALADASRDQLGVLTPEIKHEYFLVRLLQTGA
jgi:hypothetical protein